MSVSSTHRPNVKQLQVLGNFTQMFRWSVHFAVLPGVVNRHVGMTGNSFNVRAKSATIPERTADDITMNVQGIEVHQSGIYKWNSPITLTFIEDNTHIVKFAMEQWLRLIYDNETGYGASPLLFNSLIELNQLNNKDEVKYRYILYHAYPVSMTCGTFDSSTSDPQEIEVAFSYDYCITYASNTSITGGITRIFKEGHTILSGIDDAAGGTLGKGNI